MKLGWLTWVRDLAVVAGAVGLLYAAIWLAAGERRMREAVAAADRPIPGRATGPSADEAIRVMAREHGIDPGDQAEIGGE